ncbi:formate--tetrahydrofolate ligase [Fodinibius halophilus]|uniref:Formate--tetrahydrofolate ligase n=1 Tax=Fodinibius halophilus TaxID=1736908 RepID=A0A6M1T584_9BACT|nr:formate--tetrahydrofolate ligase [Fodinibius halophilus]NGP89217.1 formate--tetrahydrofolate ligase [Fodinibius halophilus]
MESIKIAQQAPLNHMRQFMADLELDEENFEFYGKYTGKIRLNVMEKFKDRQDGKLILVTAMTPTPAGEGKTLTSIGLGQGLQKIGKKPLITLREPSLGPVFGIKGGAAGGGYSQVIPMERINLHFNGDIHALSTAHNLLAAMLDNHIYKGNELDIDVTNELWNRAMDMNDRALRNTVVGLGGRVNGVPRECSFLITAASEIMAILALATSRADLKERLGDIVVGYNRAGKAVRARDLGAHKAMAMVLNEAIMPNLVQTLEHVPTLIHAGPFANIAHGTSSIIANKIGLKLADYVVTEAGFGADLGAEKFFDIVCRSSDIWPSAVVLVATCRAIKHHGGLSVDEAQNGYNDPEIFERGLENLKAHIKNMKKFDVPLVVAVNKFEGDRQEDIDKIIATCEELGVECAPHEGFAKGGEGVTELAYKTAELADDNPNPSKVTLYDLEEPVEEKVQKVATEIYGAGDIYFEKKALKNLARFKELGYGDLPICIAKTQSSLSDNPKLKGAPEGFTLTVTDVQLSAGARFLVIICGNMMLMPGLPKRPAAMDMDVDEDGVITGLF